MRDSITDLPELCRIARQLSKESNNEDEAHSPTRVFEEIEVPVVQSNLRRHHSLRSHRQPGMLCLFFLVCINVLAIIASKDSFLNIKLGFWFIKIGRLLNGGKPRLRSESDWLDIATLAHHHSCVGRQWDSSSTQDTATDATETAQKTGGFAGDWHLFYAHMDSTDSDTSNESDSERVSSEEQTIDGIPHFRPLNNNRKVLVKA